MASDTVEIELQVPLTNIVQGGKQVFEAGKKIKVSPEIAEDLRRREKEYLAYERSLIRDNGRQIDAGALVGNQGN